MRIRTLLIVGLLLSLAPLRAQSDLGAWYMYFGTYEVSEKWSVHAEIQHRNHDVGFDIMQLLTRVGMNYHLSDGAMLTAGYGYITNHDPGDGISDPYLTEHRIWQQAILRSQVGRQTFEHRYRSEQRFMDEEMEWRFRYRIFWSIPLHQIDEERKWFVGLYDEIFVKPYEVAFDINRIYAAVGYQYKKGNNIQLGLLNQQTNTSAKFYLQLGWLHRIHNNR
jgi:hypothetical protein